MGNSSAVIDWSGDSTAIADLINNGTHVTYAFGGEVLLSGAKAEDIAAPELQLPGDFAIFDGRIVAKCGHGYVTIRQSRLKFGDHHVFASLQDFSVRMSMPKQGHFYKTLHENFDAVRAYAEGTERVKEQDGFRYAYFYRCLNRNTRFAQSMVETYGLLPGSRVVDIACGTGWMAYLMAELGLESHACDFFSEDYFPPEIKAKVRYFQADMFEPMATTAPYDFVFLRGLTNEHRANDFDLSTWRVLFENLERLADAEGVIYWIMMCGAGKIRAFDQTAAQFFPHRRYRISGYHAAILSKKPIPDKKLVPPCPQDQSAEIASNVFADLERNDRYRLARGVYAILNEAFAAIGYDFTRSIAVHNIPLAHKYFDWAVRQRSFIKHVGLEGIDDNNTDALILCGDQEVRPLSERFSGAQLFPIGYSRLLDAWVNCPDFFTSEDQDGNYFEEFLRKVREKYDESPTKAGPPPAKTSRSSAEIGPSGSEVSRPLPYKAARPAARAEITEASRQDSAAEVIPWPGRLGEIYQVIDWDLPATEVVRTINAPEGRVAVTFAKGAKLALSEASVVESASTDAPPGTLLTRLDGPIDVAVRDGIVRVGRYSFEGRIDFWHYENQMGGFLAHFPATFPDPLRFTVERYEIFSNVIDRFTVTFGITRPSGEAERANPPSAASTLRGGSHLYLANREWLSQTYRRLGLRPGARVLDIGCGGVWSSLVARDLGLEPWGCDLYVDDYYASVSDWFHYFRCDISDMKPFPEKFDFIFFRGLTPMAYARDIFCPELVKFRDAIIDGLAEGGAIFTEIYSDNSGKPRSPNGWGNTTVDQLQEWIGRFFPNVEYGHGQYVSMLASHRPIMDPWRMAPLLGSTADTLSEDLFASTWPTFRARSMDDSTYYLLLLKLSQAFFRRQPVRATGPVFVLGEGTLANDLVFVLKQAQRTMALLGHGTALPADLPPDTFVFVLPDVVLSEPIQLDHYRITYAELIGRVVARDFWSTSQDHDLARVRNLISVREKQRQAEEERARIRAERTSQKKDKRQAPKQAAQIKTADPMGAGKKPLTRYLHAAVRRIRGLFSEVHLPRS